MWCFRQLRAQDHRAMMKGVQHLQSHSTEHLDQLEYLSGMRRGRDCHADHHDHVGLGLFDPKEENEMDRRQRHERRERQKCLGEHKHDCRRNSLM